ncbi:hypothetical protein Tco_1269659 [Tanacetum coccineum]
MASFDDTKKWDDEHTNSPMFTNSKLEIGDEFLKILQDNAFNGMDGGDVVDHITKEQYGVSSGLEYGVLIRDLAETMILYMLKKTCVELIRAL